MAEVISHRTICRLCGSNDLELVYQLVPSPIGDAYVPADRLNEIQDSYPIDMFLCRSCGLSQLLDVIKPEILYADYIYVSSSSLGLHEHFRGYADEVMVRIRPPAGKLVVDIGSNDGMLLRGFKSHGMRVLGVDPAREIAREASAAGVETLPEFFTPSLAHQIRQEYGPAAVITANNVFANIDDLTTMTEAIRDLLAPDGVFVFESFYLADLIKNMVFDFIYHEHLSAFAAMPLQSFFQRMGMELIDVKRVATKGGSLRYTVQVKGGPRSVEPTVQSAVELERDSGLYQPATFRNFLAKVDMLKQQTVGLLSEIKSRGKSIAGFGASITGTTLIYHFGIGGFLDYLVDDNPAKQGLFSPGLHLPVFPASVLGGRKPDYTLILAWRYVGPIAKKYGAFLDQGGHFIVPVPELSVI